VADYALDFPATDPFNGDATYFNDVLPGSTNFSWIQLAKNQGLAQPASAGTRCAGGTSTDTSSLRCPAFNPSAPITRAEMAYWILAAQMDEQMVTNFLCATGGDPSGLATCPGGTGTVPSAYSDLGSGGSSIVNPFVQAPLTGFRVITNQMLQRYIEAMYRRGYANSNNGPCQTTTGTGNQFCPNDPVTREQAASFIIRAKMNNLFPTSLSTNPISVYPGMADNFGILTPSTPYFSDVPATDPYYIYVQKMRELRIF
jgi:hypothetical protein